MQESFHQSRQSAGRVVSWITEKLDNKNTLLNSFKKTIAKSALNPYNNQVSGAEMNCFFVSARV